LIIDSSSIYSIKTIQPDIILLSNSPKIHLDRVIDSLHPKQVVADASNYSSYLDQWEDSCKKHNVLFHRIDRNGAFILK
jgi:competence protein ComEC